jgi:hypothetical protein
MDGGHKAVFGPPLFFLFSKLPVNDPDDFHALLRVHED